MNVRDYIRRSCIPKPKMVILDGMAYGDIVESKTADVVAISGVTYRNDEACVIGSLECDIVVTKVKNWIDVTYNGVSIVNEYTLHGFRCFVSKHDMNTEEGLKAYVKFHRCIIESINSSADRVNE